MLKRIIRIATRQSPLALWQAQYIQQQITQLQPDLSVELYPMTTKGDKLLNSSLIKLGGKGLFVKELEHAMLNHQADIAVHSMKDVPVAFPDGLMLAAICQRANPYDALICPNNHTLDTLPQGATIGTSSLRRQCQLSHRRQDLRFIPLRGNIQTRLEKLNQGQCDAIILAAAGLERMNLAQHISEEFTSETMVPAGGQGALGIECRDDDEQMRQLILQLNCKLTQQCVEAERLVNSELGGNCQTPVAVFCRPHLQSSPNSSSKAMPYRLDAIVGGKQGRLLKASAQGEQCQQLAEQVSVELINKGALDLVKQWL